MYRTKTIVNEIIFNNDKKTLDISYSKYYFLNKIAKINYNDLSYSFSEQPGLSEMFFAIVIFDKGKEVLKIVSKNGWNKNSFETIIHELDKTGAVNANTN
jgi:hypothetical protein